jgi:hypothetical protein
MGPKVALPELGTRSVGVGASAEGWPVGELVVGGWWDKFHTQ